MATGPIGKSEKTRSRILDAATNLFNDQGVAAISTHHIARAAELSPGNLYYHFRNKEEIIRAIFERCTLFSPRNWRNIARESSGEEFRSFVEFYFSQIKQFRFLFREQVVLRQADPVLGELWRKTEKKLRSAMRGAVSNWVEAGVMVRFESREEIDAFIDNSWIILNFSASYFESRGAHSAAKLELFVKRQLIAFLRPYHTARGQAVLDKHFDNH